MFGALNVRVFECSRVSCNRFVCSFLVFCCCFVVCCCLLRCCFVAVLDMSVISFTFTDCACICCMFRGDASGVFSCVSCLSCVSCAVWCVFTAFLTLVVISVYYQFILKPALIKRYLKSD